MNNVCSFGKKRSLLVSLSAAFLALTSVVALWQNRRVRRYARELKPPESLPLPVPAPHVTIILPVRNEARHIDTCLASLTAQDYPDFSIMVIDDGSTDSTPQRLAAWRTRDLRVQVQRVDRLPDHWSGKAHALHLGVQQTQGEWLLFTDADTCHEPQTLRLMMGHALCRQDDLLSIGMNMMTLRGSATPLLMSITETFLAHRFTPTELPDFTSHGVFAFGQYMLVRRAAYAQIEGYSVPEIRTSIVEDLALARLFKRSGRRIEMVDASGLLHNSQWDTWKSARQGLGKGFYDEIARWPVPLAGLPAALALIVYGLGPLSALVYLLRSGNLRRVSLWLAVLTILTQINTKRQFDKKYRLRGFWALAAPLSWAIFGAMALDTTCQILLGQRAVWKERQVAAPDVPRLSDSSSTL